MKKLTEALISTGKLEIMCQAQHELLVAINELKAYLKDEDFTNAAIALGFLEAKAENYNSGPRVLAEIKKLHEIFCDDSTSESEKDNYENFDDTTEMLNKFKKESLQALNTFTELSKKGFSNLTNSGKTAVEDVLDKLRESGIIYSDDNDTDDSDLSNSERTAFEMSTIFEALINNLRDSDQIYDEDDEDN